MLTCQAGRVSGTAGHHMLDNTRTVCYELCNACGSGRADMSSWVRFGTAEEHMHSVLRVVQCMQVLGVLTCQAG